MDIKVYIDRNSSGNTKEQHKMLAPSYPVQTLSACTVCELLLAMSDTKSVKLTTADADNHVWSSLPPALCADPLLILFNTRKHQCHSNVWQEEK